MKPSTTRASRLRRVAWSLFTLSVLTGIGALVVNRHPTHLIGWLLCLLGLSGVTLMSAVALTGLLLGEELLNVVEETVQPEQTWLWLRSEDGGEGLVMSNGRGPLAQDNAS